MIYITTDRERGQSLFELVVAIAISALIVVAMVSLATNSVKNSNFARNKALASSYAQEATEWLRGQRDSGYGNFKDSVDQAINTIRCLNNLALPISTGGCSGATITGTPFQRVVVFTYPDDPKIINAEITVSWTDSGGLHEVTSATNFSNWK